MQLTRFTDYSLRVLMHLSQQRDVDNVSLEFLAEHFNMNRHHLNKVSQRLAALDWVHSTRGKHGGLRLNPRSLQLRLGDIVATLEPDTRPMDCLGVVCPLAGGCDLEAILLDASRAFIKTLNQYTLNDLAGKYGHGLQLLSLK
jgi:Rrf2 family nitric oxide-sensitive transcriptional repressor